MPAVARKNGVDQVNTVHNSVGSECKDAPTIVGTDAGSSDVFANGIGVVRVGDIMQVHDLPGCIPHAPPLVTGSSSVFVNGRAIGRVGDQYAGGEVIISGSGSVFAG